MSIAEQIDLFLKKTEQKVFIEAEAKESKMMDFIESYNSKYFPKITLFSDGIICLKDDANKWGLELRCYFNNGENFPDGVKITLNRAYRKEYSFRFNDRDIILELFNLGYRIGQN